MNSIIIRPAVLTLSAAACLIVTGCTGDPSTGGIFWSEQQAQGRLNERQDHLESVERQTGRTQRNSTETQRRINELQ